MKSIAVSMDELSLVELADLVAQGSTRSELIRGAVAEIPRTARETAFGQRLHRRKTAIDVAKLTATSVGF